MRSHQFNFNQVWSCLLQSCSANIGIRFLPSEQALKDLVWWLDKDSVFKVLLLDNTQPDLALFSDASLEGFRSCVQDMVVSGA